MFSFIFDSAYLSPDLLFDLLNWLADNYGMETAIAIILLGLSVFLALKFITMKPKGSHAEMEVKGGNPPTNNSGINVQNIAHSTINISAPVSQASEATKKAAEAPLSQRDWSLLTSLADEYERAAGFRAAGAIYHTAGAWPRYFIMQASPRVYTATEEHYDKDGAMQYILLERNSPNSEPYKVRVGGNDSEQQAMLKSLYGLAQARSSAGKECSVRI